nr:hypothetical protein [Tanacetum cinerariifolium]
MTRSSTKELFSPLGNPEQKFHSRRILFDTPSLIESNSPKFDQISDIEEQSDEEVAKKLAIRFNYNLGGVIPSKTIADAKVAIQEMAEFSQKWHNGTSSRFRNTETSNGLVVIQAQLNNLG